MECQRYNYDYSDKQRLHLDSDSLVSESVLETAVYSKCLDSRSATLNPTGICLLYLSNITQRCVCKHQEGGTAPTSGQQLTYAGAGVDFFFICND